ncbi:hypothetical protein ND856_19315 [Leptospira bandrabouensis]|uniref:hypothetical protein n=1 Tax=Leptospira bandrabouensis TaxID=2484903 RepID=UPI00223D3418|nr:hypothetical protein [Leptospira bandrabouensis]MCW7479458.1 hypothetical protein [Leptospira bandrabouensis]MCW7487141.1 hypothetical protein [Leptospira bandrabouensis]
MKEKIYNLFLNIKEDIIVDIGVIEYEIDGSDTEKYEYLKQNALTDFTKRTNFPIPQNFSAIFDGKKIDGFLRLRMYEEIERAGQSLLLFEEIFKHYNAPINPLYCITPINNGKIEIIGSEIMSQSEKILTKFEFKQSQHYLDKYTKDNKFHFSDLINNDFFEPIKLLINNKHYISAFKLLFSAIDTFAFLHLDDTNNNFHIWINSFYPLETINVSAEELWELRNSLLHMSNFESRKVKTGKIRQLHISAGNYETTDTSILNLNKFYTGTGHAVEKWLRILIADENKMSDFFDRYDKIVSDDRHDEIIIETE